MEIEIWHVMSLANLISTRFSLFALALVALKILYSTYVNVPDRRRSCYVTEKSSYLTANGAINNSLNLSASFPLPCSNPTFAAFEGRP